MSRTISIPNIDVKQLRQQRNLLLRMMEDQDVQPGSPLDGLVNMIDDMLDIVESGDSYTLTVGETTFHNGLVVFEEISEDFATGKKNHKKTVVYPYEGKRKKTKDLLKDRIESLREKKIMYWISTHSYDYDRNVQRNSFVWPIPPDPTMGDPFCQYIEHQYAVVRDWIEKNPEKFELAQRGRYAPPESS